MNSLEECFKNRILFDMEKNYVNNAFYSDYGDIYIGEVSVVFKYRSTIYNPQSLTLYQTTKLWTSLNSKHLQTTNEMRLKN